MFVEKASLIAKNGFMFTAAPGTEAPEDWETHDLVAAALGTKAFPGWQFIGASSLDDLPEPGNDGGDTKVKGSWDGLLNRQVQTEVSIDWLTIQPYQFDETIMSMYWGMGDYDPDKRRFIVKTVGGTPLERAFMLLIADGPVRIGLHAWKASFTRDKEFKLSTEDYTQWPTRATWISQPGAPGLFQLLGVAPSAVIS
ncbi:hypothetical protein [Sciscionella sediminilitoris]|uniref:phage tail tube protein n=1 Tax=Sciscionella sediminilitoris TaxID=1445613 RepID=UPI00068E9B7D|nr:hypothetical protein [Sciscionella sp. SE31]